MAMTELRTMVLAMGCIATFAHADCFDEAASYQGVSSRILRAIATIESSNDPNARHINEDGSVDYGLMQINSVHLKALRRQGIGVDQLMKPCNSIYVAAWHLKQKIAKYGDTWDAIGAYHSENLPHRERYARRVMREVQRQSGKN
jgi:soluble lytic murein transglycosylase-like protein